MKKFVVLFARAVALTVFCALLMVEALPATSAPEAREQPMRDSVARLAATWNAGDGRGWAAEFWSDGSLINILGVTFPDAKAVGDVSDQILAGPFKGSTFAGDIRRVRFAGDAAAIVDADIRVTNFRALPPGAVPTSPGVLFTKFTFVFEKRGSVWKIEAAHNTAVLPGAVNGQPS